MAHANKKQLALNHVPEHPPVVAVCLGKVEGMGPRVIFYDEKCHHTELAHVRQRKKRAVFVFVSKQAELPQLGRCTNLHRTIWVRSALGCCCDQSCSCSSGSRCCCWVGVVVAAAAAAVIAAVGIDTDTTAAQVPALQRGQAGI